MADGIGTERKLPEESASTTKRSRSWTRTLRSLIPLLYAAPLLTLFAVFVFYPIYRTIALSFMDVSLSGEETFVGLDNFRAMLEVPTFWQVLRQTAVWVGAGVAIKVGAGLITALVLNRDFKFKTALLVIVLVPWATPYVVSAVTWRWMLDGLYGYVNSVLMTLGLINDPVAWLTNPRYALLLVLLTHAWTGVPFCALTILSGLYSIPRSLYDAAQLDGANALGIFRYITWPFIHPIIVILVVLTGVWGFNAFETIFVMTGGGPGYSSEILVVNIYRYAFQFFRPGMASAIAVSAFLILLTLIVLYVWISRRLSKGENWT